MHFSKPLLLALGLGFALAASAQWQWTDKDGNKVFSDRAPPSDIPDRNIVRRPGGSRVQPAQTPTLTVPGAAASPAVDGSSLPGTAPASNLPVAKGTDPALEEKKRQAEEADAARKKADDNRLAAARADSCSRSRQAKASFDSGLRIARTNAQGEREIMDDAARAAETKRLQDIIAADCR